MVSDKNSSIVIESTKKGIKIYDNVYGVLTNNPEFPYHLENMNNYINLSPNIKRPFAYFNPLVEWLDNKGIRFKSEKPIEDKMFIN